MGAMGGQNDPKMTFLAGLTAFLAVFASLQRKINVPIIFSIKNLQNSKFSSRCKKNPDFVALCYQSPPSCTESFKNEYSCSPLNYENSTRCWRSEGRVSGTGSELGEVRGNSIPV